MSNIFYIYTTGIFNSGDYGKRTPYEQWSRFVLTNLLNQIRSKFRKVMITHFDPMTNSKNNRITSNSMLPEFADVVTTFDESVGEQTNLEIKSEFTKKPFNHKVKKNHIIVDFAHVYNASRKDMKLKPGCVYDYTNNRVLQLNAIYLVDYAGSNYYKGRHKSSDLSWLDFRQGSALFTFDGDKVVTFIDKLKLDRKEGKNEYLTIYDNFDDNTQAELAKYYSNITIIKQTIKHTRRFAS